MGEGRNDGDGTIGETRGETKDEDPSPSRDKTLDPDLLLLYIGEEVIGKGVFAAWDDKSGDDLDASTCFPPNGPPRNDDNNGDATT
jgi:hypothetical protein